MCCRWDLPVGCSGRKRGHPLRWAKGEAMAKIAGARHAVLGVRDPQRSIAFYTEAVGMELVNFLEEIQMAFFSFGEGDHDLAIVKVPDDAPVGSSGLAHTAFEIDGGPVQLQELYLELKDRGVDIDMTADHVVTKSLYFLDPDGNRIEFFTQMMSPPEAKQYLRDARSAAEVLQPLDLEASA